ncbi:hypothetical protein AAHC03_05241 [Spirometra sp. Aus1]
MTQYLPPNLLALFAPRDPIPFLPPIEKHKHHRKLPYTGVAQFLGEFEDPSETPAPARIETREERKERKRREKQEQANYKLEQDLALWNPKKNPNATGNPYNTLFVARLASPINCISMIKDIATGKPRGYAFIEFEHERDMHAANKDANNRKIDGHRILTDIERGRTRPDWRPRRLGKGLGKSRSGPSDSSRPIRDDRDGFGSRGSGRDSFGRDRDRERHRRSRSREYRDKRKRSRSREYRRRSRDRSREPRRRRSRDRYRGDDMAQYGEYGAEIRAEYNGDY